MNDPARKYIRGRRAVQIADSVESALHEGHLCGGGRLPTVRELAGSLGVSPATVAAAYRTLRGRGLIVSQGRRGTRLCPRPHHQPARRPPPPPAGARRLDDGNPDPALLPDMAEALRRIDSTPCLYGHSPHEESLVRAALPVLRSTGVADGDLCVVSGAMDGIERVLAAHVRAGDAVAVEDPGFSGHHDLATSLGLRLVPVTVDAEGPVPDDLERAARQGARALIVTPRVQSPTGAALSGKRARDLRRVLREAPDLLLIEDDHGGFITEAPYEPLHDAKRARWAYLRSLSKAFNPDLRVAILTGDRTTTTRVLDRQIVAERWVSHLLQRLAAALLAAPRMKEHLRHVTRTYARRREALKDALAVHGFIAWSPSGYNVWLPVREETATVQALAARGWLVAAGERFRIASPPAIRITAATLEPEEAPRFAADLAGALAGPPRTRTA